MYEVVLLVVFLLSVFNLAVSVSSCPSSLTRSNFVHFDPSVWSAAELSYYTQLNSQLDAAKPQANSSFPSSFEEGAVVSGTSEALAIHVGKRCLLSGGNAVDCAIAVAMSEIVLAIGEYISFLGHAFFVVYNSSTTSANVINGGLAVPLAESDPKSIPNCSTLPPKNGRTIPVPGGLAAMQLAADCYGTLPWSSLLESAIYFASQGFPLNSRAIAVMYSSSVLPLLNATEEGRQLLWKSDGSRRKVGDIYIQAEVAEWLQQVSIYGANYIYEAGQFRSEFVKAVNANGGKMQEQDLQNYQSILVSPYTTTASFIQSNKDLRSYSIYANGAPSNGGLHIVEELNLLEQFSMASNTSTTGILDFSQYPHDSAVVAVLMRISSYTWIVGVIAEFVANGPAILTQQFSKVFGIQIDFTPQGRTSKSYASTIYSLLSDPSKQAGLRSVFQPFLSIGALQEELFLDANTRHHLAQAFRGSHSAAVVVSDSNGLTVSLLHSINSEPYGSGVFVSGIALPNAFCSQQGRLQLLKGGDRVPDETEPLIAVRLDKYKGSIAVAGSEIGTALRESSLIKTMLLLATAEAPQFQPEYLQNLPEFFNAIWPTPQLCNGDANLVGCHFPLNSSVAQGLFDEQILMQIRNSGIGITEVPASSVATLGGFWVGLQTVNSSIKLASAPTLLNGYAEGL